MAAGLSVLDGLITTFKSHDPSQDWEQVLDLSNIHSYADKPLYMTAMGNYMYLAYRLGNYGITRVDLTDPSKKETKIYESEVGIGHIDSFKMYNKEYLIFHTANTVGREYSIDGKWVKVGQDKWIDNEYMNKEWRWDHYQDSQIILFDLQTCEPMIIKDECSAIPSLCINEKDKTFYFIDEGKSYGAKGSVMYSIQFFRNIDVVRNSGLVEEMEIMDGIIQIIIDILGEYGTVLNEMPYKNENYWSMDYCEKTNRLYCGKFGKSSPGNTASLWYYNLDDNKDEDDEKILVEKDLSATHGICVDEIGIVYHGGMRNQMAQDEEDIAAFSGIEKNYRHRMDILKNVAMCKDICYCDGYVYFLGFDMIGRVNVKNEILRYMLKLA